jgi:hypothetical protein
MVSVSLIAGIVPGGPLRVFVPLEQLAEAGRQPEEVSVPRLVLNM